MASTGVSDSNKSVPEMGGGIINHKPINLFRLDFILRFLLFSATVTSVVVMVISKETKTIRVSLVSPVVIQRSAKFHHSPAFIYFIAANSVACVYSVFTMLASLTSISKPSPSKKLLFTLSFFDLLLTGIVSSATGAASAVAYIGLKGNSHVQWREICGVYSKFCRYIGSSVGVSIFSSSVLVLLVILSTFSLYRRSH